ncbi:hypothetical protein [Corynebacterium epidermidicanis]|uniref:Uncharacterized protein n=1 Tax=Corynebacterium epidermidicanis TaxID=1050174 RepID=A0A0G3GSZ8_9CORY|nr:hypothetical protein [Corynebacterium epidermidicanis]AKK03660.1 hypothetical protein CEPID_09070 [Corynebacterium epidermidicanis]
MERGEFRLSIAELEQFEALTAEFEVSEERVLVASSLRRVYVS